MWAFSLINTIYYILYFTELIYSQVVMVNIVYFCLRVFVCISYGCIHFDIFVKSSIYFFLIFPFFKRNIVSLPDNLKEVCTTTAKLQQKKENVLETQNQPIIDSDRQYKHEDPKVSITVDQPNQAFILKLKRNSKIVRLIIFGQICQ